MENNGEKNKLIEAAREAARSTRRFKIVQLREIFDEVEEAFRQGATYKIMVAELSKQGLDFTVRSLETTRSRIKSERHVTPSPKAVCVPPPPPSLIGSKNTKMANKLERPAKPEQHKPISGDEIKKSLRGKVNLKQYE